MEIASLKKHVIYNLLQELDKVCTKLCAKKGGSILRNNTYSDMIQFEWNSLLREISDRSHFYVTFLLPWQNVQTKVETIFDQFVCVMQFFFTSATVISIWFKE